MFLKWLAEQQFITQINGMFLTILLIFKNESFLIV